MKKIGGTCKILFEKFIFECFALEFTMFDCNCSATWMHWKALNDIASSTMDFSKFNTKKKRIWATSQRSVYCVLHFHHFHLLQLIRIETEDKLISIQFFLIFFASCSLFAHWSGLEIMRLFGGPHSLNALSCYGLGYMKRKWPTAGSVYVCKTAKYYEKKRKQYRSSLHSSFKWIIAIFGEFVH